MTPAAGRAAVANGAHILEVLFLNPLLPLSLAGWPGTRIPVPYHASDHQPFVNFNSLDF